jgi:hypothetical protein
VGGKRNDDIKLILNDIIKGTYGECVFDNIRSDFDISNIIKISPKNKKIISYTLDGNFHNVYENILQAEQDLNVDNSCISECLNGKRNVKRAGKYMFMLYEENFQLKIEPYKKSSSKPILIYKDGVFIEEIPSLNELERKYKIPKSSLCRYLNGKGNNPLKNNYDFKYKAI